MTTPTAMDRLRARIDRLPASWRIIAFGFTIQLALALVSLGIAFGGSDRVGVVVAAVLTGIVVIAGLAALPAAILFRWGRYQRGAATLAAVVGAVILIINEGHPTVWPFSLALLIAAVRGWVRASIDAADLLRLDPDRFERIEPPTDDTDE